MQGEVVFSFFFFVCGTFLLSKELWEPKEELRVQSIVVKNCQKNSKGVFLLEVHYRVGFEFWDLSLNHKGHVSAVKSRQIFNLSSGTPWIWNPSFFCAFFGLCTSVCAHTCSLSFWHDQAHSSFYSCLPHFFLSLSPCGLPRFVLFFSFRYGVPASLCAMLPYTQTGWQNGLGLRQRMWPGGSPRGIGSSSWVMRKKMRCCHMVPRRSKCLSSPIPGMIVGSFLCPLSPPFFCALWLFTRLPLNEVHVICRHYLYVFFKMIAFFLLPSFHAFRYSQLLTKKKMSEKEERARKRDKEEELWPSAIEAAYKQRK